MEAPSSMAALKETMGIFTLGCGIIFSMLIVMEFSLRTIGWWTSRGTPAARPLFMADWPANFVLSIHSSIIGLASKAAIPAAMFAGYYLSPLRIPFNEYTAILYFLAAEFCFYFNHRIAHEVRMFWADHSIHHSSESYNFTLTWRLPPFNWVYKVLVYTPVAMLGFDPLWILAMLSLAIFQVFIHTDRIGRMGLFDYIFCSPANHAIHHARNPQYVDKNYGGVTVIWDHVFGTFALPGKEKIKYGVTHRVSSGNVFKIWWSEFGHLIRDAAKAPTWRDKLIVLFGRPGETFEHVPGRAVEAASARPEGKLAQAAA